MEKRWPTSAPAPASTAAAWPAPSAPTARSRRTTSSPEMLERLEGARCRRGSPTSSRSSAPKPTPTFPRAPSTAILSWTSTTSSSGLEPMLGEIREALKPGRHGRPRRVPGRGRHGRAHPHRAPDVGRAGARRVGCRPDSCTSKPSRSCPRSTCSSSRPSGAGCRILIHPPHVIVPRWTERPALPEIDLERTLCTKMATASLTRRWTPRTRPTSTTSGDGGTTSSP